MTKPAARPRRWWKYFLIAFAVFLVAGIAAAWYITTDSFQAYVRSRLVKEVERITGGRAEIGSFHVVPFHMQVEVRNITVHGKEAADDVPLAHADSLLAQVKVISLLKTEFGFNTVVLDHPTVHIVIGPDGATTNIVGFKVQTPVPVNSRVEQLFALSIDHLTVRNGELLWGDQKFPLDFSVHGTNLQMDYSFLRGRYDSHLSVAKVDTSFEDFRPFAWMASADFSVGGTFIDIQSLNWTSGRSSLKSSGRISDFQNPHLVGNYEAQIDLEEAAAVARRHDLRQGVAQFKGNGECSLDEFTTGGAVVLKDLGWQDEQFLLRNVGATADYSVTDQQLKLSKLQGRVLGGIVTGDAQVDHWLHGTPLPAAGKGKREEVAVISAAKPLKKSEKEKKQPGVQSGVVRLRLRDVSVAEMASALDVRAHPLGPLPARGTDWRHGRR